MNVIVTDSDKLREILDEIITETVKKSLAQFVDSEKTKQWLTKDELKELTGWSDRTIQDLRDKRLIPFSQHGRKILYPNEGIEEFLRSHEVKAIR